MDQRQREVQPALHAARVAADAPVGCLGEPDPLEQRVAALLDLGGGEAVEPALEPHVLAPRQQQVERRVLERDADHVADRRALADDVVAGDRAVPAVGGSSVVSMWTVVDFPAPFGPRNP